MDETERWNNSWKSKTSSFDKIYGGFPTRSRQDSAEFMWLEAEPSQLISFEPEGPPVSVRIFSCSLPRSQINEAPERTTKGQCSHVSHKYGWPDIDLGAFFLCRYNDTVLACLLLERQYMQLLSSHSHGSVMCNLPYLCQCFMWIGSFLSIE